MYIIRYMDKEILVYGYNMTILSNNKQQTINICIYRD